MVLDYSWYIKMEAANRGKPYTNMYHNDDYKFTCACKTTVSEPLPDNLPQSHCKVRIESMLTLGCPIWCNLFPNVEELVLNLASPCQEAHFQHDPSSPTCDVSPDLLHALYDTTAVIRQILSLCSRDTALLNYQHTITVGPCLEHDQDSSYGR